MTMIPIHILIAALTGLAATSASAATTATYTGTRSIGGGNAQLSFTTDGFVGNLSSSPQHLLSWTITVSGNGASHTLVSSGSAGGTASLLLSGTGLSVSATAVSYNFGVGGYALFQERSLAPYQYYCLQGGGCYSGSGLPGEGIGPQGNSFGLLETVNSDTREIATLAGAVPEPTSWAMLITGFAMTGAAMRRRVLIRHVAD